MLWCDTVVQFGPNTRTTRTFVFRSLQQHLSSSKFPSKQNYLHTFALDFAISAILFSLRKITVIAPSLMTRNRAVSV